MSYSIMFPVTTVHVPYVSLAIGPAITNVRWQQRVHEQSYCIVHYIRRKEEGKEGRKKQTNTNNLEQPQRLTYVYMYSISQLGMQMHCAL